MSLITRCPACATMFKVVPDQLRVSEGWVRCGQCSEVFDANANLLDPAAPGPTPPLITAQQHPIDTQEPAPSSVDINLAEESAAPETDAVPDATTSEVEPEVDDVLPVEEPFLAVNPHALYIDSLEDGVAVPEQELRSETTAANAENEFPPPTNEADAVDGDKLHHSFLQPRTATPPPIQRRAVRVTLALFCAVLVVALLLQVAVHERDRLVALEPATKGVLEPLCDLLDCKIAPLRSIESVVIDSSSFTKIRADVYRLGFTLKNTTQLPLATPALELTLTDLQDQTVVRKVFLAADFGDKHGVLEPGAELPASLAIAVRLNGNSEKISGYRLLSFYP